MSNDRSETGFKLSAKNGSRNNCTYHVISSFRKIVFFSFQANYINALAVSVLRPFESARPITLGELYFTLGELVFTFHLTIFNVMFRSEYF
jgi:hypothetical protein